MIGRKNISSLSSQHFDVVIIGGGINGAASAQQLAARGFNVLLVDKGDFGSGSSSRSSRLLHCGLRYLAPGRSPWEFALHPSRLITGMNMARLAVEARHEFLSTTKVRTQLSKLYFPIFKGGPYSGWQVDIAFKALDYYNRDKTPLNYRRIRAKDALSVPLVSALRGIETLDSVATYDEYQMSWPERVTVDMALDAKRLGATAINYVQASLLHRNQMGWEIELRDTVDNTLARVTAEAVVNTAGIWIDDVLAPHRQEKSPKVIGTKGSHIVVELSEAYRSTGIATINRKSEPFYCLPWGKYHYIGPTEVIYEGDLNRITTTTQERDWLLGEANHLFPQFNLTPQDVVHTWSGVRPLTWDPTMPKGNRSRVLHDLSGEGMTNVFAMTGGPLMTHRSAGVEIADVVSHRLGRLGRERIAQYHSDFPNPQDEEVLPALTGERPEPAWLSAMVKDGMIVHLSDALMRRCGLPWYRKLDDQDIEKIGWHLGMRLGWNDEKIRAEIEGYQKEYAVLQVAGS
jgi:glycerol-3-phosphate dehydrogenase